MRFLILLLLLCLSSHAQTKLVSWNLQNFGKSKSDSIVQFIAKTIKDADIIALQEIVSNSGGSQAVSKLVTELNRNGAKWDYVVSNPTTGIGSERYAFIWKTNKIKIKGKAFLDKHFADQIVREPYIATFSDGKKEFTLISFHAVPKKKQPEAEIKYLKFFPDLYNLPNMIFLGDFNCPESNSVFIPLKKMGWKPALVNQRTTLKMECVGMQCLASEYDNLFVPKSISFKSGVVNFYTQFPSPKAARKISDHLPVYMTFVVN